MNYNVQSLCSLTPTNGIVNIFGQSVKVTEIVYSMNWICKR